MYMNMLTTREEPQHIIERVESEQASHSQLPKVNETDVRSRLISYHCLTHTHTHTQIKKYSKKAVV
jgi:hypothetical protein